MFADLAGFTALSEQLEPTVLVGILNGYFERMSQAITDHRGLRVKLLLDDGAVSIFWRDRSQSMARATIVFTPLSRCARRWEDYNEDLQSRGLPQLALGIGLHCGTGVVGLMGSTQLKEFAFGRARRERCS